MPAGVALARHDGDLVITTPGTVIDGLDVYGFVVVRATGVTIRNTVVRGREVPGSASLVTVASGGSLTIEDSELVAAVPSPSVDGLRGQSFTARRVNIHGVVDSVRVLGGDVTIESSWLHDNLHYANDPNWNGGPSHDDNIQVQGGGNIRIAGNTLSGSYNAALMVTHDVGAVSNLTFVGNRVDGGGCSVNIGSSARGATGVQLTGNTFGRSQRVRGCAMIAPSGMALTASANTFTDGAVARVSSGS